MSYEIVNIRFSYKHCNFAHGCLLVRMAFKIVTRSISSINRIFASRCLVVARFMLTDSKGMSARRLRDTVTSNSTA